MSKIILITFAGFAVAGASVLGCGAAEKADGPEEETALEAHEKWKPVNVKFTTSDGWEIYGTYFSCQAVGLPPVICLHMLRHDRSTYERLIPKIVGNGLDALAIDSRGHGESTTRNGEEERFTSFDDDAYNSSVEDIAAAKAFMAEKGADTSRLVLVGASIGANYSLIYAAGDPDVKAVVLLSPGVDYHGVKTEAAMKAYAGRPVLIVASSRDTDSVESAEKLKELGGDKAELKVFDGDAHGTEIFDAEPDLESEVVRWISENCEQ